MKEELRLRPITALKPRAIAPKGTGEQDRPVGLAAIVSLTKKEQTPLTQAALRLAITQCYRQDMLLDF